ncbi:hypothetical protein OPQ81_002293 [Rhizoctonia solani]|nr:hypothetical protein OPQ81_002293 [Rhizoctonia solani]
MEVLVMGPIDLWWRNSRARREDWVHASKATCKSSSLDAWSRRKSVGLLIRRKRVSKRDHVLESVRHKQRFYQTSILDQGGKTGALIAAIFERAGDLGIYGAVEENLKFLDLKFHTPTRIRLGITIHHDFTTWRAYLNI